MCCRSPWCWWMQVRRGAWWRIRDRTRVGRRRRRGDAVREEGSAAGADNGGGRGKGVVVGLGDAPIAVRLLLLVGPVLVLLRAFAASVLSRRRPSRLEVIESGAGSADRELVRH